MASFTEQRRARLRKAVDRVEKLEARNTITEPISVTALSLGAVRALGALGIVQIHGGDNGLDQSIRRRLGGWLGARQWIGCLPIQFSILSRVCA